MIKAANLSIYAKFVAALLIMLLTLSTFVGFITWNRFQQNLSQQLERHGLELAANLASLGAKPILSGNSSALFELINEANKYNEDVRYIFITDHHNRLLAHTFITGFPNDLLSINRGALESSSSISLINIDEEQVREVRQPVENGGAGFVYIGMSERTMNKQLSELAMQLFFIALAGCIAAAFLAAHIAKSITEPLRRLANYAEELRQGKTDDPAVITGTNEVGKLGLAFRQLASTLNKTNQERDTLIQELREKEQLQKILLNKVLTAQEDERKRISRELHDEAGQSLTSLIVSLRILADRQQDEAEKEILLGARELAASTLTDIRALAVELRPPAIDDLGLIAAMGKYIADFQRRTGICTAFAVPANNAHVNTQTATALYRIMQESLTNVIKHSGATCVEVTLEINLKHILLSIIDNGRGFSQHALSEARREDRLGIYGMTERAELLGGTVQYTALPGQGTTITVIVPNPEEA